MVRVYPLNLLREKIRGFHMKSKIFRMIMATTMVTTMLLGTLTGCTAKDGGAEASGSTSDSADRPDTWIADRTITIQA